MFSASHALHLGHSSLTVGAFVVAALLLAGTVVLTLVLDGMAAERALKNRDEVDR